ncbi:hypothetical protein RHGRI_014135 [Rhododendron griersonianum]|uniref:Uncharacterized protein n=1 Tax=Rhododendron griersonianum TaxID=479676 RepID=A0AAV6I5H6_9ERIC|nr:hypothetical protein RHGRI_030834 [Rhododendron griersonianum]KAG5548683.1 hypothetical protein RHGRI_014135 [Rhododendron griersonianum]
MPKNITKVEDEVQLKHKCFHFVQLKQKSNSRRSSVARGGEGSGRHHWSPFNVVLRLWIQLVFTVGQIIAAICVLSVSTKEYSQTRLLAWIVGYAVGSTASLPVIYWRYLHQNQGTELAATVLSPP